MERTPEPELMDDPDQALAYASADFSEPHNNFIKLIRERFGDSLSGTAVDLGCGPGDICRRFANAYPGCQIHGIDGSGAMLKLARSLTAGQRLDGRISYFPGYLPDTALPLQSYDIVLSNSLLHHLKDPAVLWKSVIDYSQPGSVVFVMDLLRPDNHEHAEYLVTTYADNEPEILKNDFFNSLLAAYRPEEVRTQLDRHGLERLQVEVISDRHFIVFGCL